MTNKQLLEGPVNNNLLTTIEQQKRFILRQAALKKPCPNCNQPVDKFEAAGLTDVEQYDFNGPERKFRCPSCKRELLFIVPIVATTGWVWALKPINVNRDAQMPTNG